MVPDVGAAAAAVTLVQKGGKIHDATIRPPTHIALDIM